MRPILLLLLHLALLLLLMAQPLREGLKVAIVVGVERYQPARGFEPLQYAEDDAQSIARVLRDLGYTVQLLTDKDADLDGIHLALQKLESGFDFSIGGTALFYFSGHGSAFGNENYLIPYNALKSNLKATALPVSRVARALEKSGAKQRFLFLDACRSAPAKGANTVANGFQTFTFGSGTMAMLAASLGKESREYPELEHGAFTYFLIEALRGKAARDGAIDYLDVHRYVSAQVQRFTTDKGFTQVPQSKGEFSGSLVLGYVVHTPAPPKPIPPSPGINVLDLILPNDRVGTFNAWMLPASSTGVTKQKLVVLPPGSDILAHLRTSDEFNKQGYGVQSLVQNSAGYLLLYSYPAVGTRVFWSGNILDWQKEYNDGFRILSAVWAGERWFAILSKNSGLTEQRWRLSKEWPEDWILENWKQDFYITHHAYSAKEGWMVIMSKDSRNKYEDQSYQPGYDAAWIEEKRKNGLRLIFGAPTGTVVRMVASKTGVASEFIVTRDKLDIEAFRNLRRQGYWIDRLN